MTRPTGQISAAQALTGIAVVVLFVLGTIEVMSALLPPQDPTAVRLAERLAQEAQGTALPQPQPGIRTCPPAGTASSRVSSTLLYECPRLYDERVVVYTGEVVGAVLRRDDHAWVQLNDDAYATTLGPLPSHGVAAGANSGVAVRIPLAAADRISNVGGHERRGDRLTVRGVFRRADPDDGGGTVIVADEVVDVARGGPEPPQEHPGRRIAALVLLPPTLLVVFLAFRRPLTDAAARLSGRTPRRRRREGRGVRPPS